MSTIAEIVSKQVTDVTVEDMANISKVAGGIFLGCNKLKTVSFPSTLKSIGYYSFSKCNSLQNFILPEGLEAIESYAFDSCTTLTSLKFPTTIMKIENTSFKDCENISSIDTSGLNWQCLCFENFQSTKWFKDKLSGLVTIADGQILVGTKSSSWSTFPSTIKSLTYGAFNIAGLTEVKVPDTVQWIIGNAFNGTDTVKVDIGSGVSKMMKGTMSNPTVLTWIFRQPASMVLDLPKAGENTGLGYNKDSRSITIYTDNESLKAYDWAADNITATIKPLSEAP